MPSESKVKTAKAGLNERGERGKEKGKRRNKRGERV